MSRRARRITTVAGVLCAIGAPAASADVLTPVPGSPFPAQPGVHGLAWSPDGAFLATTDSTNSLTMHAVGSDGALTELASYFTGGSPESVAFTPDGEFVVNVNAADDTVAVWSVAPDGTLSALGTYPTGDEPTAVAVNADGVVVTANLAGDSLSLFAVNAGGLLTPSGTVGAGDGPASLSFTADGKRLAVAVSEDDAVRLFSVTAGGSATQLGAPTAVGDRPLDAALRPDGSSMVVSTVGDTRYWTFTVAGDGTTAPTSQGSLPAHGNARSLTISPDGTLLGIAAHLSVALYSIRPGGTLDSLETRGGLQGPWAAEFDPSGTRLAVVRTVGAVDVFSLDVINPTVECGSVEDVWHADNVSVDCTAADGQSGLSGGSPASFSLFTSIQPNVETPVATTNHRSICDKAANCVTAGPLVGIKIDRKPPSVQCGDPDPRWLNANATLTCVAQDNGSGLADPDQGFILLQTNVPAGAEDGDASTNSVEVCDAIGNCATAGPILHSKIDRKAPETNCDAASSAWLNTNASISCSPSDAGAGLAEPAPSSLTLTTSVPAGTVNGNASTNSVPVCDAVQNCTNAGPVTGNKIDRKAPSIACGAASPEWVNANASIPCTSSDTGSGLADPAQAAFALTTDVPAGSEDANAVTNSVEVCDAAGNCPTAGPIAGNKVDRKAPVVSLTSPAANARYSVLLTPPGSVRASYSCSDGTGGSGLASCTGTRPNGAEIPTGLSAYGRHTFTVTGTDVAGNRTTVSHSYSVLVLGFLI